MVERINGKFGLSRLQSAKSTEPCRCPYLSNETSHSSNLVGLQRVCSGVTMHAQCCAAGHKSAQSVLNVTFYSLIGKISHLQVTAGAFLQMLLLNYPSAKHDLFMILCTVN